MTPADWQRVEELFHRALERPEGECAAWLAGQTAEPAVREEVRSLLNSLRSQDALACAAGDPHGPSPVPGYSAPALPADRFGAYRLVRLLGRGGMSAVYLAERIDGLFEREVAIKVVAAHLGTEDFLRRFHNEGRLLANLQHPNIASLLDGGVSERGQPYLVLELVEGERLDHYCDSHKLPIPDRLRLFRQVCEAVDYAHRNQVLHRDLKPGNILVTVQGVVKLLDFGTAALIGQDSHATVTAARMLTPRYASPEQLSGERPGVPGDVFSLGVILYELLAGAWPFGETESVLSELRRATGETSGAPLASAITPQVAELRATDLAALRRCLQGDLAAIAAKALENFPERRYSSVRQLVEDLDRHQAGAPVEARRNRVLRPNWIRFRWRWLAAALLLGSASTWFVHRARVAGPNRRAAEFYQLGQYHWNRHTRDSLLKAVDSFQLAVAADPNFAAAYASLADSCAILPEYGDEADSKLVETARRAAHRALELDNRLSMAHGALAWIAFSSDWNWAAAEPEFRTAIDLAPGLPLPHQRYGLALITRGRFVEAESELRRAQELDPVSVIAMINLAELWYYARRFDQEEEYLRRVLELDPNSVLAYAMLAELKMVAGRAGEAIALTLRLQSLPEGAGWCQELAEAYARDGQRDAALRVAAACSTTPVYPSTYMYLGDYSRAMDILERRYAAHSPYMMYLNVDPNYDQLRNQVRFQQLLKKLGF